MLGSTLHNNWPECQKGKIGMKCVKVMLTALGLLFTVSFANSAHAIYCPTWDVISLVADNGKYVSAFSGNDYFLVAEGNHLGMEDKFEVIVHSDCTITLIAMSNGRYVSAFSGNDYFLKAEGTYIGDEDKFEVIAHSDGYFTLKAIVNDKYVSAFSGNDDFLRAEGEFLGPEDKFEVIVH